MCYTDDAGRQQRFQYTYKVKHGEVEKVVCTECSASIHGIGTKRVRRIAEQFTQGLTPKDNRGRHENNRKLSGEIQEKVDDHLRSFPYRVSHYGGHGNKRRYLSSELSVLRMYNLFIEKFYPGHYAEIKAGKDPQKLDCEVKYRYYHNYYKVYFNYGFGRPKTDICHNLRRIRSKY